MNLDSRLPRASALGGAIAWLTILIFRTSDSEETELIQRILLLGILVIVPLGLSLVSTGDKASQKLFRLASILQPIGAVAVLASHFLSHSLASAALASLWLLSTSLIALIGVSRLLTPHMRSAAQISIDAGLIFLPVGAAWLVMSRMGVQLLGFGDTIVLLTAVHFHFAGFAAPILAGLAGINLPSSAAAQKAFRLAAFCIIAGTPLVAGGITFSPALALLGAAVISLGLLLLSFLVLRWVVPSLSSRVSQGLLVISSLATLPAMVLACAYAYSIVFHQLIIDIPQMAMTHGILNAFGFALCGLLAWALNEN